MRIEVDQSGKIERLNHDTIETFREAHKPNKILNEKEIWRLLK